MYPTYEFDFSELQKTVTGDCGWTPLCYLAGPVDLVEDSTSWRNIAKNDLAVNNIASFSPAHAFKIGETDKDLCRSIQDINNSAVENANVLLANLSDKSYGTPLECQYAVELGIPVFAFGSNLHRSIYRFDFYDYFVTMHDATKAIIRWAS